MAKKNLPLKDKVGDAIERAGERLRDTGDRDFALNHAIAGALTAAAGTALRRWASQRRPGGGRLVRGLLAGAGAAGLAAGARRLLGDDEDTPDFADEMLLGAGRGLVYVAILDPLLPGPPAVRGALTGMAEYMAAPWGGALGRLSSLTPARKLPLVGALLDEGDQADDPFVACLIYGVALGILTGTDPRSHE